MTQLCDAQGALGRRPCADMAADKRVLFAARQTLPGPNGPSYVSETRQPGRLELEKPLQTGTWTRSRRADSLTQTDTNALVEPRGQPRSQEH
jgi:hypothetical protein